MSIYSRKGTKVLWYRFQVDGKEHRGSTGETDRRRAAAVERRERAKVEAEPRSVRRNNKGLVEVAGLDRERAKAVGVTDTVIRTMYMVHWRHLTKFFGSETHPRDVTPRGIMQYVNARREEGIRGQTIRRELTTLKRGLTLAKREGWIAAIPDDWPRIKSDPKKESQAGKLHPPEILAKWLQLISPRLRDEIYFALMTGVRHTELKRIRAEWIIPAPPGSPTPAILRMPDHATKSRYGRDVGLSHEAMDIVKRCIQRGLVDGMLFGPGDRSSSYKRARKELGYSKNITLRDCRHTFGSLAIEGGSDITAVMRSMGHRDLRMAELYQHSTIIRTAGAAATATDMLVGTVIPAQLTSGEKKESNIGGVDGTRTRGLRRDSLDRTKQKTITTRNRSLSDTAQNGDLQPETGGNRHTQTAQSAQPERTSGFTIVRRTDRKR